MKPSYMYTLLLSLAASVAAKSPSQNLTCIADSEVEGIAHRWLNAFATGGIGGLPDAVTNDVGIESPKLSGSLALLADSMVSCRSTYMMKALRTDQRYPMSKITTTSTNPSAPQHTAAVALPMSHMTLYSHFTHATALR